MIAFLALFAPAFLAGVWLVAGFGHLLRPRQLPRAIVAHRVIAPVWAWPAAVLVTAAELALGAGALLALVRGEPVASAAALGSAALALAFLLYLGRLLSRGPAAGASCGCSPWAAPVTGVSLLPAGAILVLSLALLLTPAPTAGLPAAALALAALWGLTLAALVLLLPAAAHLKEHPA